MTRPLLVPVLFFCTYLQTTAQLKAEELLTNELKVAMCVDSAPQFSWIVASPVKNTVQSAYMVNVLRNGKTIWSSGKKTSSQSVRVAYSGPALTPATDYAWQVRIWDNHGNVSPWSAKSNWRTGLLKHSNWQAQWVEADIKEDSVLYSPQLFRKEFATAKNVKSATAFITSHGLFEALINGNRVGEAYLTPGWTSYNKRLQYMAFDVTDLLNKGRNAVGVTIGSGWYRGPLVWEDNKNHYGDKLALLMQINITYTDGTTETVVTDNSWKARNNGPIRASEIYDGEIYDANMEMKDWALPGFSDGYWKSVVIRQHPKEHITAIVNEPVTKHETFSPVKVITTPKGEKVIDFGQNLVGWVQLTAKGKKGDSIKIYHAEVLDRDGNFYTENLRGAKQRNIYILNGENRMYEPHFTFQGFRYIKVEGYNGELQPKDFLAVALYSDMANDGEFECSHPLVNQLQKNIIWGQKGNFVDVPTDCPQRDERLGWTGDAQVFVRTAAFNMRVGNFFEKWLKDLAADQLDNGAVPHVIPDVLKGASASAGWADAAAIIPWNLYWVYGDTSFLANQYKSMKAWVDYTQTTSKNNLWNSGFHFGDWLFYRPNDDTDGRSAITDKYLIAQSFWANSADLLVKTATVLGKNEDAAKYKKMADTVRAAFLREYVTENGRLVSGTQTAYVLALNFDMLPESLRQQAADRLVENVRSYGTHLTTGFLGTPYLCHVLSRFGHTDLAYELLLQETYPSWLYPVKMGATTIWERWDGQKTDGTFQNAGMNSFNHYAYGAIGDWMYRTVTGIEALEPGYKKIRISPRPSKGLDHATATYKSVYGSIRSAWKREGEKIVVNVSIPCNTTAVIELPGISENVGSGNYEFNYLADQTLQE